MLTPNHLIFGRSISPLPYGEGILEDVDDDDPDFMMRDEDWQKEWRRLSKKLEAFKSSFAEEYLAYLRERHAQAHHEDPAEAVPINVGDLVVIKSETEKRCMWEMAEIIEILPSSDDRVRAVRLRTKNSSDVTRPIVKLCPLLSAKELRPEQNNQPEETEQRQEHSQPTEEAEPAELAEPEEPADAGEVMTPQISQPPQPPVRPQRAAKTAAQQKVKNWAKVLRND